MEGFLQKRSHGSWLSWQRRFCYLFNDIFAWAKEEGENRHVIRSYVKLAHMQARCRDLGDAPSSLPRIIATSSAPAPSSHHERAGAPFVSSRVWRVVLQRTMH